MQHLKLLMHTCASEELVPLALLCNQVDNYIKFKIVGKLTSLDRKLCSKRHGSGYGKPTFPKLPEDAIEDLDLSLFIGEDSWLFFTIMRLDKGFLDMSIKRWESDSMFISGKQKIKSLSVVKPAHDFLDTARKEDKLQNILQVVENHRHSVPNQRKRKLDSKSWFLKFGG